MCALFLFLTFIVTVSAQCPFPGIPGHGHGCVRSDIASPRLINEKDAGKAFKAGDIISYSCDLVDTHNSCNHTTLAEIKCQQNGLWNWLVGCDLPKCRTLENIGGYDWFRRQFLEKKKHSSERRAFTDFNHAISSQFNFLFKRNVHASDVDKVEVELDENTISDLKVALIVTGNEFYNCSLLRKWSNRQIFNCRNPKITNKLIQDIEIRAVVETKLKQVNATIKPIKVDYCGSPAVPINGVACRQEREDMSSPHRFRYECYNGSVLQGEPYVNCYPATGKWTHIPTCKSKNVTIDNKGEVFEDCKDLSFVASSALSSQKCNIFIIALLAILLLINHL